MKSKLSFEYFAIKFKNKFNFTKMISIPLVLSLYYKFVDSKSNKKLFLYSSTINFKKILLPELDSLKEGEMKEIKFGRLPEESILLVKVDNKLHALSNYCPHYGAQMHKGFLNDNILKCHLDGASFDIYTGFCETAPSLDGLNKYEIIRNPVDKKLYAMVDLNTIRKGRVQNMIKRDPKNQQKFVIIGGGPAALSCAETLRQAGFTGEICIFSDEDILPYDRSQLSKNSSLNDFKSILLRDESFLNEYDIEVIKNSKVIAINNTEKSIKLSNGLIKVKYFKII
jgi:apoptosis-inducing factor 3